MTNLRRRQRTESWKEVGNSSLSRQLQGQELVRVGGSGGNGPEPRLWPGAGSREAWKVLGYLWAQKGALV